jgi:uncharacterized protein (DUF885 family)
MDAAAAGLPPPSAVDKLSRPLATQDVTRRTAALAVQETCMTLPARVRHALTLGCASLALLVRAEQLRAQAPMGRTFHQRFAALATARGLSDSARLQRLFDLAWEYDNIESPEFATYSGYPGQNGRWTDRSVAALTRRERELPDRLLVLRAVTRARLSPANQLSYDIFKRDVDVALEGLRFPSALIQISQLDGPQYLESTIATQPAATVKDYEDILARLAAIPTVIGQTRILLDSGLARGVTPPRITLRDVPAQVQALTPDDAMRSPLLEPFTRFPASIEPGDRTQLRARAVQIYQRSVRPAYRELHDYLVTRYLPGARESLARGAMPNGKAWYAYDVKVQTTLSRTPAEIHRLGLAEVKRIRAAMDSVIRATGFTGDFAAFTKWLRTEPRFFYSDSASLVRAYRDVTKRIDPELASQFGKLPRLPYGVTTIASFSAPSQTTAYYQPGSPDAHRPGQFYVNTYKLDARPIWEMEALSAHEAVPGHHLQIALAQELEGIPQFRRYGGYTGFVEGWALYSESLGPALGLYADPYSKFGQLTYEVWRAIRLVVDTGIHDQGWTRDQAIEYFTANSAKTAQDIVAEVDRYITWPGQALAYKSGELEIKALRALAERELGTRFDVRAFHDEILGQGALPLDVLDTRMKGWIAREKGHR